MCVDVGFFFVRHFPPELRRKKEGRLNDVGGGSGQWEQEWKEGPSSCPPAARRPSELRMASIRLRGGETRRVKERPPPPSAVQTARRGARKEAEVQGHHVFHKKGLRDNLNYPSIIPFGNALKTPLFERKQDTGISCRATRPTDLLFLVSLARRKTATGNKSEEREEREGGTLQRECLLFLPFLSLPFPSAANETTRLPSLFRCLPLSLLLSKK